MDERQEEAGQTMEQPEQTPPATVQAEEPQTHREETSALSRLLGVDLELRVELARVSLPIREILDLSTGAIVDLKKAVGEPVNIFVNDKSLAKGEVVVVEDLLGIRITEIVSPSARGASLS